MTWSPIPSETEIGHEEALFRRAWSRGRNSGQGNFLVAWSQGGKSGSGTLTLSGRWIDKLMARQATGWFKEERITNAVVLMHSRHEAAFPTPGAELVFFNAPFSTERLAKIEQAHLWSPPRRQA